MTGSDLIRLELVNGSEYVVFPDIGTAEMECRDYWQELAGYDPQEFRYIVGDEKIVEFWISYTSFDSWLDDVAGGSSLSLCKL